MMQNITHLLLCHLVRLLPLVGQRHCPLMALDLARLLLLSRCQQRTDDLNMRL